MHRHFEIFNKNILVSFFAMTLTIFVLALPAHAVRGRTFTDAHPVESSIGLADGFAGGIQNISGATVNTVPHGGDWYYYKAVLSVGGELRVYVDTNSGNIQARILNSSGHEIGARVDTGIATADDPFVGGANGTNRTVALINPHLGKPTTIYIKIIATGATSLDSVSKLVHFRFTPFDSIGVPTAPVPNPLPRNDFSPDINTSEGVLSSTNTTDNLLVDIFPGGADFHKYLIAEPGMLSIVRNSPANNFQSLSPYFLNDRGDIIDDIQQPRIYTAPVFKSNSVVYAKFVKTFPTQVDSTFGDPPVNDFTITFTPLPLTTANTQTPDEGNTFDNAFDYTTFNTSTPTATLRIEDIAGSVAGADIDVIRQTITERGRLEIKLTYPGAPNAFDSNTNVRVYNERGELVDQRQFDNGQIASNNTVTGVAEPIIKVNIAEPGVYYSVISGGNTAINAFDYTYEANLIAAASSSDATLAGDDFPDGLDPAGPALSNLVSLVNTAAPGAFTVDVNDNTNASVLFMFQTPLRDVDCFSLNFATSGTRSIQTLSPDLDNGVSGGLVPALGMILYDANKNPIDYSYRGHDNSANGNELTRFFAAGLNHFVCMRELATDRNGNFQSPFMTSSGLNPKRYQVLINDIFLTGDNVGKSGSVYNAAIVADTDTVGDTITSVAPAPTDVTNLANVVGAPGRTSFTLGESNDKDVFCINLDDPSVTGVDSFINIQADQFQGNLGDPFTHFDASARVIISPALAANVDGDLINGVLEVGRNDDFLANLPTKNFRVLSSPIPTGGAGQKACVEVSATFFGVPELPIGPTAQPSFDIQTLSTQPSCNDGVDNDGDGQIDFPNDTGCVDAADNRENNIAQAAPAPNAAPFILSPAAPSTLTVGTPFSVTIVSSDATPDNIALSLDGATPLPPGTSLQNAQNAPGDSRIDFVGTLQAGQANFTLDFNQNDGTNPIVKETVTFNVNPAAAAPPGGGASPSAPPNTAPFVISAAGKGPTNNIIDLNLTGPASSLTSFTVIAADADGDNISFSIPATAGFSLGTKQANGSSTEQIIDVDFAQILANPTVLPLTLNDGINPPSLVTLIVSVNQSSTANNPPVVLSVNGSQLSPTNTLDITLDASQGNIGNVDLDAFDADGDNIRFGVRTTPGINILASGQNGNLSSADLQIDFSQLTSPIIDLPMSVDDGTNPRLSFVLRLTVLNLGVQPGGPPPSGPNIPVPPVVGPRSPGGKIIVSPVTGGIINQGFVQLVVNAFPFGSPLINGGVRTSINLSIPAQKNPRILAGSKLARRKAFANDSFRTNNRSRKFMRVTRKGNIIDGEAELDLALTPRGVRAIRNGRALNFVMRVKVGDEIERIPVVLRRREAVPAAIGPTESISPGLASTLTMNIPVESPNAKGSVVGSFSIESLLARGRRDRFSVRNGAKGLVKISRRGRFRKGRARGKVTLTRRGLAAFNAGRELRFTITIRVVGLVKQVPVALQKIPEEEEDTTANFTFVSAEDNN